MDYNEFTLKIRCIMARSGINKVILVGNLGKDPDMRYTAGGDAVANLSIATSESWNDNQTGEKKEKTEWHRVVFFNKPAETIGQYVKKGQQLYVEGRLQTRKWQDKDGVEKYSTDIISDNFTFIGSKSDNQEFENSSPQNNENFDQSVPSTNDDDIPF